MRLIQTINHFVGAFAANDPQSTLDIYNKISSYYKDLKKCIFLNTRSDRQYRTIQLLSLVYDKIVPDKLIIRGNKLDSIVDKYDFKSKAIEVIRFNNDSKPKTIIDVMGSFDEHVIFGIGNIGFKLALKFVESGSLVYIFRRKKNYLLILLRLLIK